MRALQHDLQHDLQWMGREAAEDTPVRACMPSAARPSPHAYWGLHTVQCCKWWHVAEQ